MDTINVLRNDLIGKLLTISDKSYLVALHKLLSSSKSNGEKVSLTKEQELMLKMSDSDIVSGKIISQSQLDKSDLAWLKEL